MIKKIFFILIILLIFILTIVKANQVLDNKSRKGEIIESNGQVSNPETDLLSEEEKNDTINKLKDELVDTTNKIVLEVNDEKVNEREIAYVNYQLKNSTVNEEQKSKNATDEIIKDYVICQDAQKQNISLTDKEIKIIEDRVNNAENMDDLLKSLNLTYDELQEMYVKRTKKLELKRKWVADTIDKINAGKMNFDDETYNAKYKEYRESEDVSIRYQLLMEMLDMYTEYLVSQAKIEKVN